MVKLFCLKARNPCITKGDIPHLSLPLLFPIDLTGELGHHGGFLKWMVKIMGKAYEQMGDLGGYPTI